jgi:hypothetical protein
MSWDWSTAGKMNEQGKPFQKKDEDGHVIYDSKKGDFVLAKDVVPDYIWFNGTVEYTLLSDKIDPTKVVQVNRYLGDPHDGKSLIFPTKLFRGKQPYDAGNNTLVAPHTAGTDDAAYWNTFNWPKAIAAGMATTGTPFSGKIGFVETEMRWPINHMVAPKENALACQECHSDNGRLKNIQGIYMPGRDSSKYLDLLGGGAAFLALLGVLGHGTLRIFSNRKKGGN